MSLLFQDIRNEPQTHVIIIGVGGYKHLDGGADAKAQDYFSAQTIGQLTSPPVSAKAFFDTVKKLHEQNHWLKPLGSVEVLVSTAPEMADMVFDGQAADPANIANINDAYWAWKSRCDSNPDNVAIFYFCGHGLDKGEHFLLAEDFGQIPGNPWKGSFAFDMTRRAFFSCRAETQLFFVDACRQLTSDMLTMDIPLNPIEPPNLRARDCKFNLTQKAAAANEGAYGKKGEVSFYTKALIGALTGNAANNDNEEWCINTGTIAARMNSYLQMEAPTEGHPQRCISVTSDVTDIIQFSSPPIVPLTVSCNPDDALPLALLSCKHAETSAQQTRAPANDPWSLQVEAGIYHLDAQFAGGEYQTKKPVLKSIVPPAVHQKINCMP